MVHELAVLSAWYLEPLLIFLSQSYALGLIWCEVPRRLRVGGGTLPLELPCWSAQIRGFDQIFERAGEGSKRGDRLNAAGTIVDTVVELAGRRI